jgi:predicted metal-dependent phosphoesterase TrpH
MKVDFHLHTAERSGCAQSPARDMLAAAHMAGLGAVAITDHHRLTTPDERAVWEDLFPGLMILPGIEITLDEWEDIVVVGLDDPGLTGRAWTWPALRSFVRERGGFTILAHPYRYAEGLGIDVERDPPDAVEGFSSNLDARDSQTVGRLAETLDLPLLANSDAHWEGDVGCWCNRLHEAAGSVEEILAAVRERRFSVEVSDPLR